MAGLSRPQWGTTPPVSEALPNERELSLNDALLDELKLQNNFESSEETEKRFVPNRDASSCYAANMCRRAIVLKSIQQITTEFVKVVGRKKGMPQTIVNEAGGKIFTFGSYRLGVFGPGWSLNFRNS